MMTFIMLTVSTTVAILLAMGVSFIVMTNPKVVKWYTRYICKTMKQMESDFEEDQSKGL